MTPNVNNLHAGCYSKLEIAGLETSPTGAKDRLWSLMKTAARHRIAEGWRMLEPGVWRAPWVDDAGRLSPTRIPAPMVVGKRKPAQRAPRENVAALKARIAELEEALMRLDSMIAA
jgi:hypothetical protein